MKKLLSALALAACTLGVAPSASAAIVVQFVPSATQIAINEAVTVDMNISGLDAEILSAFDIDALFDASVLTNNIVTHTTIPLQFGAFPDDAYFSTSFDVGRTGVIDGSYLSDATLAAMQADSFTVLRFTFVGVADGSTQLTLGPDLDFERNFTGLNFQSLAVAVQGVCIAVGTGVCAVQAVSEPASIGLATLALFGAFAPGALRRRRQSVHR